MTSQNLTAVGKVFPPSGFGKSDGCIKLHLCQRNLDQTPGQPIVEEFVKGTGPFTIDVHSGWPATEQNFIKTVENQPVCEDPINRSIPNVIIDGLIASSLPYVLLCKDASLPQKVMPLFSGFFVIQPPFVTLEATINPGGEETSVQFEYGLGGQFTNVVDYGKINGYEPKTIKVNLKAQIGGVSSPTSALLPGKTYSYRVKAINSKGVAPYGEVKTFDTPSYSIAPEILNLNAIDIS